MTPKELLEYIRREMAGDEFEVLGSMLRREGGGEVYFARELDTARLVALRFEAQAGSTAVEARYTLGVSGTVSDVSLTPSEPGGGGRVGPVNVDASPTDVLTALRQQSSGEFEVLGEMGKIDSARFFLARELASGEIVALRLLKTEQGFTVNVHQRLERSLASKGSICAGCGSQVNAMAVRCPICGRPFSGGGLTTRERSEVGARLSALSAATDGAYEFIGEMSRANDSSTAYFARRTADGAIVGMRSERASSFGDEDAVSLRETDAMDALKDVGPADDGRYRDRPQAHSSPEREWPGQIHPPVVFGGDSIDPPERQRHSPVRTTDTIRGGVPMRFFVPGVLVLVIALFALLVAFGSCG